MKKLYTMIMTFVFTNILAQMVFAEQGKWGTNTKNWILEEARALAIGALVIIMIPLIVKKAWAGLAGTVIAGGIAVYLVGNPTAIESIGKIMSKIIFGNDIQMFIHYLII